MTWLNAIQPEYPIAHAMLVLALVAASGLALGNIKVRNIALGVAGVLFAGLVFGHFGVRLERPILDFVREFGLVLFVYTIGLQIGPGFITSLRREGLPLNLMAAAIVLLGAGCTVAASAIARIDMAAAVGLFSGATTNTPALGAAQQALKALGTVDPSRIALPGLGYAVAYPFGIIGIILVMLLFRILFRVDLKREATKYREEQTPGEAPVARMSIEVGNANLNGLRIGELPGKRELQITISRIQFAGEASVRTAHEEMIVNVGDTILAVGPKGELDRFRLIVGFPSPRDLMAAPSEITFRRVVVTRQQVLGKSVGELAFAKTYGVAATRLERAGVEMPVNPALRLQFGDQLLIVGEEAHLARAAKDLGNSLKALNRTDYMSAFIGIALGVLFGLLPIHFPGIPVPVRLGMAGGPLLVAIFLSRVGRIGPVLWYMPDTANGALRELGIVLFLACVGLRAGEHFVQIVLGGDGLLWIGCAAAITALPLLIVGAFARIVLKQNFTSLCGLLSGSMTDPPALAFANHSAGSDAPSISYAAVYPLTMLLRIVVAQILVLLFVR